MDKSMGNDLNKYMDKYMDNDIDKYLNKYMNKYMNKYVDKYVDNDIDKYMDKGMKLNPLKPGTTYNNYNHDKEAPGEPGYRGWVIVRYREDKHGASRLSGR